MKKYLAIFDFDYTVVDDNTDTFYWSYLPEDIKNNFLDKFNEGKLTWHQLLNVLMPLLPWDELIKIVTKIKMTSGILELFDYLIKSDSIICIVSDSNTEFIKQILKQQNIEKFVKEIHTNGIELPTEQQPTVKVVTYEKAFDFYQIRKCDQTCDINHMCKGTVVEKLIEKYPDCVPFFAGDGGNDYCAMKRIEKLSENGLNFVRRGFRLEAKINKLPEKDREFVSLFWESGLQIKQFLENQ